MLCEYRRKTRVSYAIGKKRLMLLVGSGLTGFCFTVLSLPQKEENLSSQTSFFFSMESYIVTVVWRVDDILIPDF